MNSLPPSISLFRSASIAPATPCKGMRRNPRRRGGKAPSDAASTALRAPRALNACATPRHAAPQPVGGRRVLARVLTDARSHEHGSAAPRPPPGACAGRRGVGTLARSRRPGLRPPSNLRRCPTRRNPLERLAYALASTPRTHICRISVHRFVDRFFFFWEDARTHSTETKGRGSRTRKDAVQDRAGGAGATRGAWVGDVRGGTGAAVVWLWTGGEAAAAAAAADGRAAGQRARCPPRAAVCRLWAWASGRAARASQVAAATPADSYCRALRRQARGCACTSAPGAG